MARCHRRVGKTRKPQHGMTLIELAMVVAIVASLTIIAASSGRRMMGRMHLQLAQADLVTSLRTAQAEAAGSGMLTIVCPTLDQLHCSDSTHWESGWLVAPDANQDNQPDGDPLQTTPGYAGKLRVLGSVGRRNVRFRDDGTAEGTNITLILCLPASTDDAQVVVVSNAGRIRTAAASTAQAAECAQAG